MKRIYTVAFLLPASLFVNAQNGSMPVSSLHPVSVPAKHQINSDARGAGGKYLDYEGYDGHAAGDYTTYIYFVNGQYTVAADGMQYVVETFDSLYLTGDYTTWTAYDYNTHVVTIDSVFYRISWFNNSGSNDTLTVSIVALGPTPNYRPTNTVLWSTQIIQNTGPGTGTFYVTPNYVLPAGNRFGIRLDYTGALNDTFAVVFGYPDDGSTNCGAACLPTDYVNLVSAFYSSAYYKVPGNASVWPNTVGNGYWYFDCNCNSTAQNPQENWIQNWSIWTYVNILPVGINDFDEKSFSLTQNSPNPVEDKTSVYYNLKKTSKVSLKVVDVVGQEVMNINEGTKSTGIHHLDLDTSNLKNGVYFYTLTVNNTSSTRRMVVSK